MMRSTWIFAAALCLLTPTLRAQEPRAIGFLPSADSSGQLTADSRRLSGSPGVRRLVHYGKWLTALGTAAFTVLAAQEHGRSEREWDALLAICRSADDACLTGSDGRYLRSDAEVLYQRSRYYDRRANRRLLGAQASLVVTAALFLLDLRPGDGPDNIPFSPVRVTMDPKGDGAEVGLRIAF